MVTVTHPKWNVAAKFGIIRLSLVGFGERGLMPRGAEN